MAGTAVPSAGSLQSVTVGEVLRAAAAASLSGLVRFDGDDQRLVALAEGRIYLATSASGPSIHQIVVGSGAAPDDAWVEAGAAQNPEGIGAALDDDPRVDSARLRAVLGEHVVSTVVELLAGGNERYEVPGDQSHQLGARIRFEVDAVLAEAEHRLAAWRSISGSLPTTATRVRLAPTLARGTTGEALSAVEWQVLAAIGGGTSVAEVIAGSGLSAFTVFDVLHRLLTRSLVVVADDAGP